MKQNTFLLFILILCTFNFVFAQEPEIIWQHTYGGNSDDRAQDILATDDGGYLTIGYTNSTDGDILFNHGLNEMLVVNWIVLEIQNGLKLMVGLIGIMDIH